MLPLITTLILLRCGVVPLGRKGERFLQKSTILLTKSKVPSESLGSHTSMNSCFFDLWYILKSKQGEPELRSGVTSYQHQRRRLLPASNGAELWSFFATHWNVRDALQHPAYSHAIPTARFAFSIRENIHSKVRWYHSKLHSMYLYYNCSCTRSQRYQVVLAPNRNHSPIGRSHGSAFVVALLRKFHPLW